MNEEELIAQAHDALREAYIGCEHMLFVTASGIVDIQYRLKKHINKALKSLDTGL